MMHHNDLLRVCMPDEPVGNFGTLKYSLYNKHMDSREQRYIVSRVLQVQVTMSYKTIKVYNMLSLNAQYQIALNLIT